jgi:hypothetical protein
MINEINVDDFTYDVKIVSDKDNIKFSYKDKDDEWYTLEVTYTPELVRDLKSVHGINVEEELISILKENMKLEISKKYDGEYWNKNKGIWND